MAQWKLLLFLFLAIFIRFWYFPSDISFTYDQARDAYASLEIASGHLKILGPTTVIPGIHHGVLTYYIFAPLYSVARHSPEFVSLFMRFYNACAILVIFSITKKLFNSKSALIATSIAAVSFEQTQFALFLGHPAFAIIPILLFYNSLISRRFAWAGFFLGLAIQFHFAMTSLGIVYLLFLIFHFRQIKIKTWLSIVIALSISLSSFILAEFKFGFRTTHALFAAIGHSASLGINISNVSFILTRYVSDNLLPIFWLGPLMMISIFLLPKHKILLAIWLLAGIVPYIFDHSSLPIYYYTMCGSVAIIILVAYWLNRLPRVAIAGVVAIIFVSNITSISKNNPSGVIPAITVQSGMLLSDQKRVIDHIYQSASTRSFAVNAVTNPYDINTTWSYLFEWYGQQKYGYLPTWGGQTALGYAGNLPINTNRSTLPPIRFTILEPERGLDIRLKNEYLQNENYFTKIQQEKHFGEIVVQKRHSY